MAQNNSNPQSGDSLTRTQLVSATSRQRPSQSIHIGTLRLRGEPRQRPSVSWAADVIDNSNMNKKKSKVCCIYHKPRAVGESSSESSSSSSESDSDSEPDNSTARMGGKGAAKRKRKHDCNHHHDPDNDSSASDNDEHTEKHDNSHTHRRRPVASTRPRSPNAYEKMKIYKNNISQTKSATEASDR